MLVFRLFLEGFALQQGQWGVETGIPGNWAVNALGGGGLRSGVTLNLQLFVPAGSAELTAVQTESMSGCSHGAYSCPRSKQGEVSASYCNLVFLLFHL